MSVVPGLREFWRALSPKRRRMAFTAAIGFSLLAVLWVGVSLWEHLKGGKQAVVRRRDKPVESYVFTGKDTKHLTQEAMAAQMAQLADQVRKLQSGEIPVPPANPATASMPSPGTLTPTALAQETAADLIDRLPDDLGPGVDPPPKKGRREAPPTGEKAPYMADSSGRAAPGNTKTSAEGGEGDSLLPWSFSRKAKREIRELGDESDKDARAGEDKDARTRDPAGRQDARRKRDEPFFLPSGAIISGTLITGLDAPTANQARRDPFPALLRVKAEALLPNRFRMDLRECFLISGGYGDLSSERVYLRAETLSCVRQDGGVIESGLNAYAVGEDSKAGIRGRVVTKNGQLLAQGLIAGFFGGLAETFKPARVPALNLSPGGHVNFETPSTDDVLKQGALGGAQTAAGKIADYYLDMARNIFPVIELDGGRQVDFVVVRGTKLAMQTGSRGNQAALSRSGAAVRSPSLR